MQKQRRGARRIAIVSVAEVLLLGFLPSRHRRSASVREAGAAPDSGTSGVASRGEGMSQEARFRDRLEGRGGEAILGSWAEAYRAFVMNALRTGDDAQAALAIRALGELAGDEDLPNLLDILADEGWPDGLRREAALALLGSGKSTLLNVLGVIEVPNAGVALFEGRALAGIAERARFRVRTVGFLFQAFHWLPSLSAIGNVQVPMLEMPWGSAERERRACCLLQEMGMGHCLRHRPGQLSGGERQRVAAARSLANEPRLLLADEPTGNLDSRSARSLLDLLEQLCAAREMALVLVTHDPDIAARASRVARMTDGKLEPARAGPPA